ncbi:cytochrome c oxidase assembly factor 4 homolog, mitochondrial [Daktulosphaira vitifoliae]|uniref:cytochrome c oxidase assembly factor 4 homolog, mitochondrial n=1 Tax=Daktulosphaira vitifoliae TaxID=58002 RepID=UPI0021A9CD8E|nr:cytochrome c oxidase assembly factor 4 homolog, mitochondrial [Daktulosphaira vitifoliae]
MHSNKQSSQVKDDEDLLEELLNKTNCAHLHYKVQDCISTTKDWRKCQAEVKAFKECIEKNKKTSDFNHV